MISLRFIEYYEILGNGQNTWNYGKTYIYIYIYIYILWGHFYLQAKGVPLQPLGFFCCPTSKNSSSPLSLLSLQLKLISQRGEEEFFNVGQQKKPKGYKGHPQPRAKNAPTIKGSNLVVPLLLWLMLIRPEGEGDFFDVGYSKNCIRPKAKKHVTEYPHIYIYIYIYGSTKKINDRDTQKSMTSEDQLCQFQVLAVCMQLCTLNWFQGTYMDQNIPHGAGVLQDYGKLGCSNQGAPFWFFNIHTYIYIYIQDKIYNLIIVIY